MQLPEVNEELHLLLAILKILVRGCVQQNYGNRSSFGEEEITLVTAVFLCCTIGVIFWYITGSVLLPKKVVVKRTT